MNFSTYSLIFTVLVAGSFLVSAAQANGKHHAAAVAPHDDDESSDLMVEGETFVGSGEAPIGGNAEKLEVNRANYKNLLALLLEREEINRKINELVNGRIVEAHGSNHENHLVSFELFSMPNSILFL